MRRTDSVNVTLAGGAGQGLQAIEGILVEVVRRAGYHVFATKEYMSRVRGGLNSTTIRISSAPLDAYSERVDVLLALDKGAVRHLGARAGSGTLVLGDRARLGDEATVDVPLERAASEEGSPLYANSVAAGVIAGMFGLEEAALVGAIRISRCSCTTTWCMD